MSTPRIVSTDPIVYDTDTIEDLEFLARDAWSWARNYANTGRLDSARIEREAAASFEAEIKRRKEALS
jgi:hypothetical protein